MFEYVGVIHIHSVFSDGTGKVDEIADYANEVNLDYIILTDHNTLRALKEGYEKYYGKTLLIVGCEINDKQNKNHYLAIGINETISTRKPAKEYVSEVNGMGGIGFLAHPHEKRNAFEKHPAYPWTDWDVDDFTGIEIWNHMSEWAETLTEDNKYNHIVHPLKTIEKPYDETLEVWDQLNLKRKVVGIGGVDAHAHKVNFLGMWDFEVFPYKVLFKSIRTHVFTKTKLSHKNDIKHINSDKKKIIESLKNGNCYFSNYNIADAKGFRFCAEKNNKYYEMGDFIEENQLPLKLNVILPTNCNEQIKIKLIRNGKLFDELINNEAEFLITEKGVYRTEILFENKYWIFSNHIRIGM